MSTRNATHISHDEILTLCREVSAQGAEVKALTRALEVRNGTQEKVFLAMRETLAEMAKERDMQLARCNQRFRDVEKQVFPGIQHCSKRFWAGIAGLIAAINLMMTLAFRLFR